MNRCASSATPTTSARRAERDLLLRRGHILIDGRAQSAPLILANIRKLGFEPRGRTAPPHLHEHYDSLAGSPRCNARRRPRRGQSRGPHARCAKGSHSRGSQYGLASGPVRRHPAGGGDRRWTTPSGTGRDHSALHARAYTRRDYLDLAVVRRQPLCRHRVRDSLTPVSDDGFRFTGECDEAITVETFRGSIARVEQLRATSSRAAS